MLLGASQGSFTAAPYIIAREVNEPKDMPKSIDILSSCIAICVFGGSILADFLADSGQISLAILFPIIPLVIGVLLIGILSMYYLSSMNAYSPLAVQQVLGASATTSGSLQLPRTIIIIVLPTFVGIWIGKNKGDY